MTRVGEGVYHLLPGCLIARKSQPLNSAHHILHEMIDCGSTELLPW